jgi:hypothetical protein
MRRQTAGDEIGEIAIVRREGQDSDCRNGQIVSIV